MSGFRSSGYSVALTQQELDALSKIVNAGDRGSFYLTYAAMTDSHEALLQAKISTFSGLTGGEALAANWLLQKDYGVDGAEVANRYSGIYFLSQKVALSAYTAI